MTEQETSITDEFLGKYDPQNAANLSQEDTDAMKSLTDEQLKALADKYPNQPTGNNYLVLWDNSKPNTAQIGQLSTWATLYDLRVKYKQDRFVAAGFRETYKPQAEQQPKPEVGYIADISTEDVQNAPGITPQPITDASRPPIPPFNETNNTVVGANIEPGGGALEANTADNPNGDNVAPAQDAQPTTAKRVKKNTSE